MLSFSRIRALAAREHGFTLIEVLVAMVTSLAIVLVLFTMLKVAGDQTTLVTDTVAANRTGRQTMTHVVDELHSACIAREFSPIQPESTANKLVFFNAYSENAELESATSNKSEGVYKHEIVFNSSKGTLTDNVYKTTSIALPATPKVESAVTTSTVIGEHLTPYETGSKKFAPVFEYLQYASESNLGEVNSSVTSLEALPPAEGEKLGSNSTQAAGVNITFEQRPSDNTYKLHQGLELQTQVTLALGAPNTETPIKDEPCY